MDFLFRNIRATIGAVDGITTKISGVRFGIGGSTLRVAIGCILLLGGCRNLLADTNFAAQAERNYQAAFGAWRAFNGSATAAVAFAEAAFTRAEFAGKDSEREEIANRGIEAARSAIRVEQTNAAAHYWLGMNLGQLARTKMLGALPLIRDIADEFYKARDLDEKVDHAGPDRSLGLLFRDAPGWPTSIGNKSKGRQHLLRAVQIAPQFPENQLCLLESYEKWGERPAFDRQFKVAESTLQAARTNFTGPAWAYSWHDWQTRFDRMAAKAEKVGRVTAPKGAR